MKEGGHTSRRNSLTRFSVVSDLFKGMSGRSNRRLCDSLSLHMRVCGSGKDSGSA